MEAHAKPDLARSIAAAFDWWREAGLDSDFRDEPVNWLAQAQVQAPVQAQAEAALPRAAPARPRETGARAAPATAPLDRAAWPQTLDAFTAWWLSDPALDHGRVADRVPPRGAVGAPLMIIVPHPEPGDSVSLLSGPQGRLIENFLASAGIAPDDTYVASVLPRHTPMADWAGIVASGFADLLAHHVALARPQRIAAFTGSILPLTGNGLPNMPAFSQQFNHEGGTVPMFAARDLPALLDRPRWKSVLWQEWLDWTRDQNA